MPVEPGILDANILAYASNADDPKYAACRVLIDAANDPSVTLYVTPQILCEFYSVIANPRRVAAPSSPAVALQVISALLGLARYFHFAGDGPRRNRIDGVVAPPSRDRPRDF